MAATLKICDMPAANYMFKVNNRNTRTSCKICSKLTINIPERRHAKLFFMRLCRCFEHYFEYTYNWYSFHQDCFFFKFLRE